MKGRHLQDSLYARWADHRHSATTKKIRHFITSSSCLQARSRKLTNGPIREYSDLPSIGATSRTVDAQGSFGAHATSKPRKLNAAEREWLYEGDVRAVPASLSHSRHSAPRFDWRSRALSYPRLQGSAGDTKETRRNVRRSKPESIGLRSGDAYFAQLEQYKNRFLPLIEAEQSTEAEVIKRRLNDMSLQKLQEEGYCLTGLSSFWLKETRFGRPVAAFTLGPGLALPNHLFQNGTQILLSRVDPRVDAPKGGSVVSHNSTHLNICFEEDFDVSEGLWRMDLGFSNIAYERMRKAIDMLNLDPTIHEQDPRNSAFHEVILQGTKLRDVLLRTFSPSASAHHEHTYLQDPADTSYVSHETLDHPSLLSGDQGGAFKDDMRIQSWAARYKHHNPIRIPGDPELKALNPTQIRAAALMIGERISLIQGPPGTGKTRTIIQTVKLLKRHFEIAHPILVCTYTNVAVDNLVEGFAAADLRPLRIGSDGKIRASLESHSLEKKFDLHPSKPEYDRITNTLYEIGDEKRDVQMRMTETKGHPNFPTPALEDRLKMMAKHLNQLITRQAVLKSRLFALQQNMTRDIVMSADVICTTCITSVNFSLNVVDFPVVLLDEASMSTEPASLIPLMKGCRHLALIGDHKQLPPVITSPEAQAGGLSISLFERLAEERVVPSIMLDTQYRMHPGISRFPSTEFYRNSLKDGTVDTTGHILSSLMPPISSHLELDPTTGHRPSVIFLDHQGPEGLKNRSRVNWTEGYIITSVVEDLLLNNQELRGEHIGIIAPYVSQISLLSRLLTKDPKFREQYIHTLGFDRAMEMANIEVKTVDGFEGREKDIIIFSTVRNNPAGHIGFLADRRRLNVGLTRAKRALFVVGNMSTLKAGKFGHRKADDNASQLLRVDKGAEAWRRYVKYLSDENLVLQISTGARRTSQATSPDQLVYY